MHPLQETLGLDQVLDFFLNCALHTVFEQAVQLMQESSLFPVQDHGEKQVFILVFTS